MRVGENEEVDLRGIERECIEVVGVLFGPSLVQTAIHEKPRLPQ